MHNVCSPLASFHPLCCNSSQCLSHFSVSSCCLAKTFSSFSLIWNGQYFTVRYRQKTYLFSHHLLGQKHTLHKYTNRNRNAGSYIVHTYCAYLLHCCGSNTPPYSGGLLLFGSLLKDMPNSSNFLKDNIDCRRNVYGNTHYSTPSGNVENCSLKHFILQQCMKLNMHRVCFGPCNDLKCPIVSEQVVLAVLCHLFRCRIAGGQ